MTADWPTWELSPLQEAAEYLASENEEDASRLWELVDDLEGSRGAIDRALGATGGANGTFQQDEYDAVWALTLDKTTPLLHQLSHSLMHLYLAIRAYSPTLEVHRSLRKGEETRVPLDASRGSGIGSGGNHDGLGGEHTL